MKTLAGTKMQEDFLKTLWLQRLPTNVQLVLSGADGLKFDKIAEMVDKMMEIYTSNLAVIVYRGQVNKTKERYKATTPRSTRIGFHYDGCGEIHNWGRLPEPLHILPDLRNRKLIDASTMLSTSGIVAPCVQIFRPWPKFHLTTSC